jgi:hypothetical protein
MRCTAMRSLGHAVLLAAFLVHPVWAQYSGQTTVGIYADPEGTECNLTDDAAGLKDYYVILNSNVRHTGLDFAAPKPDCFDAIYVTDETDFLTLGNSQTGITIAFPACWPVPAHVLTIRY